MAQPTATILDQVRQALDSLIVEVGAGQSLTASHVDRVEQLAAELRSAAFAPLRPVNPPLAYTEFGACW